jgi:hypothetical protein
LIPSSLSIPYTALFYANGTYQRTGSTTDNYAGFGGRWGYYAEIAGAVIGAPIVVPGFIAVVGIGALVSHFGEGNGWGQSIADAGMGAIAGHELGAAAAGFLPFLPRGNCFVAGTPVVMADGSTKPIEKVQPGDQVITRDQTSDPSGKVVRWKAGRHKMRAHVFLNLVLPEARPGSASFQIVVIFDPRYTRPLVVATNRALWAFDLWCLYRDRWPVEQAPLAAKQMIGCERAFVFGDESRGRLPELAMSAGNLLAYVAACRPAVSTGFWDRCTQPTCGRLRRSLSRANFAELPLPAGVFRKKASPTSHLLTGVRSHRRQKRPTFVLGTP